MKNYTLKPSANHISTYGISHSFSLACEDHVANGADFLIRNVIFDTAETLETLKRIEDVTEKSATNHSAKLSEWETETIAFHKEGLNISLK